MENTETNQPPKPKPGRNWKPWLIGLLVVLALVGGATYGAMKYYPRWRQERLLKQARAFLEWKNYEAAGLMTRQALQLDKDNVAATQLMIEIADAARPDAALSWRRRLIALQPTQMEPRLALAEQELKLGKPAWAQETLAAVADQGKDNARFRHLSGLLASASKNGSKAEEEFAAAVKLEPQNQNYLFDLAAVRLGSKDKAVAEAARTQIEDLKSQPALFARASRVLIADAMSRGNAESAIGFGLVLSQSPSASFEDRLLYLDILHTLKMPSYPAYLTKLQEEAGSDTRKIYSLMLWLNAHQGALLAVEWSRRIPAETLSSMPVPRALAQSYAYLGDWTGLTPLVSPPKEGAVQKDDTAASGETPSEKPSGIVATDWESFEYMRLLLLSRVLRQQGKLQESKNEWNAAIKAAGGRPDALGTLAKAAGEWGWESESNEVLWMMARTPSDYSRWALDVLFKRYSGTKATRSMHQVVTRMYEINPTDPWVINNLASFSLLLDKDTEKGVKLSEELHRKEPANPAYTATYAFALHLKGDTAQALQLMKSLGEDRLAQPDFAAYYGIMLSAAGDRETAKRYLALGSKATLLPEERQLVEQANAQLGKPQ